jgi:hypothetical protein
MTAWKRFELRTCRAWGGERSGSLGRHRSDGDGTPVALECKRTASTTGGIQGAWIKQAREQGKREGLPWVLVVAGHNDRKPVAVVDHAFLVELAIKARLITGTLLDQAAERTEAG